ncbi:MAG: hypothetical protein HKN88_07360 [Gammaproteobacteria bacterium]|nr:hypothetical protein [Gammaproteobacteria bacterium]NNC97876.1 hypothetical protein [Gammaproteobacteria bacterium]NNM13555.1 hypothetical protein [Gammaproteobacteria bacterium]
MKNLTNFLKAAVLAITLSICSLSVSAYEIKHGYSADDGMAYYGVCKNGKDLMVTKTKDGTFKYEGPASKGKLKKGADLDKAARKACGEERKA